MSDHKRLGPVLSSEGVSSAFMGRDTSGGAPLVMTGERWAVDANKEQARDRRLDSCAAVLREARLDEIDQIKDPAVQAVSVYGSGICGDSVRERKLIGDLAEAGLIGCLLQANLGGPPSVKGNKRQRPKRPDQHKPHPLPRIPSVLSVLSAIVTEERPAEDRTTTDLSV